MKTPDEMASEFFVDTGERKSTNWKRLRDAFAADRRELIEACVGCPPSLATGTACPECDAAAARIRALGAPVPIAKESA